MKPLPNQIDFYLPPIATIYENGQFVTPGNTFPDFQGTLDEILDWVRYNPRTDGINRLRSYYYKSYEYIKVKEQELLFITPHCTVNHYRHNRDVKTLSGILYYDIDAKEIKGSVEEHKAAIVAEGNGVVSVVGVSAGGAGLFLYLQVEGLSKDNFNDVYEYYRTEVLGKFPSIQDEDGKCILDINAKGIVRTQILSYDSNLYYKNIKLQVDNTVIKKSATRCNDSSNGRRDLHRIAPFSIIPIDKVLAAVRQRTYVDTGDADYLIEKRKILKLWIHRVIPAGRRKKYFSTYTNVLVYINPDAPVETIVSFMHYLNNERTAGCPLSKRDLERIVVGAYNHSKENGLWNKAWEKEVYIHLSDNFRKGKNRKEICKKANQLIGELKVMRTMDKIDAALKNVVAHQRKVTAKAIADVSGLSLRTVKKYCNKKMFDIINGKATSF